MYVLNCYLVINLVYNSVLGFVLKTKNKTEHMLDMPIRVRKSYGEVYNHKDLESSFLRINLLQIDGYLRS